MISHIVLLGFANLCIVLAIVFGIGCAVDLLALGYVDEPFRRIELRKDARLLALAVPILLAISLFLTQELSPTLGLWGR